MGKEHFARVGVIQVRSAVFQQALSVVYGGILIPWSCWFPSFVSGFFPSSDFLYGVDNENRDYIFN